MRSVLSISIPPKKLKVLKKKAENNGMTVSAYVLRILDEEDHMISEEEFLKDLRQGEKDLANGNYRTMGPDDAIEDFLPIKK